MRVNIERDPGQPPHLGVLPQQGQERLRGRRVAEPDPGERLDLGPVEGEELQLPGIGDR